MQRSERHNSEVTLGNHISNEDMPYHDNSKPYIQLPDQAHVEEDRNWTHKDQSPEIADNTSRVDHGQSEKQGHNKLPSIFSQQLKEDRRMLFKSILKIEALLVIIVLGILSLYWGGLASLLPNQKVLTIAIVDFDGQEVGNALTNFAIEQRRAAEQMDEPTLGYITQPASLYNNDPTMLQAALLDEKMWVAISVQPYATVLMNYAYQNGNQSYNPADAIHVLYQEARSASVSDEFIQPFLTQFLNTFAANFAKQKSREVATASSNNLTALQNALSIPIPISFTKINLAPFEPIVGAAPTQIGLVYLIIVSFFGVSFYAPLHFQFAGKIRTREYYAYRMIMPVVSYLLLSLLYSVLSVIWGIDFNTFYGHAGFVIYWMLSWVSMLALGLPVENIQNAFGPPWTQVFLIFWVISNAIVGFFPNELLSNFYKWGLAWPFYHIVKGASTLIFGTKNWLGLNFGVLIAWAALSYALLPITVWMEVRNHRDNFAKNRRTTRERLQDAEEQNISV